MKRFKIDHSNAGSTWPFGLFFRERCWHARFTGIYYWHRLSVWESYEKAMAEYEKIKGLPQYLD